METGRIVVGRIVKVFGIRGEVVIEPTGDDPGRFARGTVLYLSETGADFLEIAQVHASGRGLRAQFEGRPDRTSVEDLAGRTLYQDMADLPPLPEGVYYRFQLQGLRVTAADGSELGVLETVLDAPANDLYEVRGPAGTWLVPARKEFVQWIDLDRGEMRLTDRNDLLEAQRDGD